MDQIITFGLDIAKNVFQVHGNDERGGAVICRQLVGESVAGCLLCSSAHKHRAPSTETMVMRMAPTSSVVLRVVRNALGIWAALRTKFRALD